MGQPEREKIENSASCGEPSATEAEERFKELFKAARVLLREGIDQEDQIIPTLALANLTYDLAHLTDEELPFPDVRLHFKKPAEDSEGWDRWVDRWVSAYGSLRPVRMVGEVLILERLPISIEIEDDLQEIEQPKEVFLSVYRHRHPAKPEHVASLYEKTLSEAGVPYGEVDTGRISFELTDIDLLIVIERGRKRRLVPSPKGSGWRLEIDVAPFPAPRMVQEFYQMLLGKPSGEGFYRKLATRTRGGAPNADNLILACVAFYLKHSGNIKSRKEIHRLLNERVLCEERYRHKAIPEGGYTSSEASQLWRDANDHTKVRKPLRNAELALGSPYELG